MKKIILFVISLAIMSSFLIGCQSNDNNELNIGDISKVSISKSSGFGKVNEDFFAIYEDDEALELFQNAITNAVKQDGMVDMVEPEYDLRIYENGKTKGYHLWIGEKGHKSTIMKISDTHTIYSISEEITNQLTDLIK